MKYLQHTPNQSMKLLMVAFAVVSGLLFVSGCALNPFASKAADATAVAPAESGIVQTSQSKKLFGVLPVYRADVQQGNFVSKEMVSQLKVGMTPEQVRFVSDGTTHFACAAATVKSPPVMYPYFSMRVGLNVLRAAICRKKKTTSINSPYLKNKTRL